MWDSSSIIFQSPIGKTQIDLEKRRWSSQFSLFILGLLQRQDIASEKIRDIKADRADTPKKRIILDYWMSHEKNMADSI